MAADPLTAATVEGILNFDSTDDEDPFNDKPAQSGRDDRSSKRKAGDDEQLAADLGLDSEVKIAKKRKPIAKLDEARLLSAPGIPKLRALTRSGKISNKLRLKGKGHEFPDVARMLNYYQLWLDNLYPRAKFADGLQLVEKVGHSKRMQVMRKEWIDEGKPGYARERATSRHEEERETDDLYAGDGPARGDVSKGDSIPSADPGDDSLFIPDSRAPATEENSLPDDDELDALLAEQDMTTVARRPTSTPRAAMEVDSEGEDDLDALLAEQETRRAPPTATAPVSSSRPDPSPLDNAGEDEEMDDLDALLAEQEGRSVPSTAHILERAAPTMPAPKDSPVHVEEDEGEDLMNEDDDDDDLEALLAEEEVRRGQVSRPLPSSATRPVTLPPPPATSNGDTAAGDDMFSSSPVRTHPTPQISTQHAREATSPGDLVVAEDDAPTTMSEPHTAEPAVEPELEEQGADELEGQSGMELGEELEAQDMFSSSPVQNE